MSIVATEYFWYNQGMFKQPITAAGLVIGVCLIVATIIGSATFYGVRSMDTSNTLSVTGSAIKQVNSDVVKWLTEVSRSTENVQEGNIAMLKDKAAVLAFLKEKGFAEKDIVVSPIFLNQYTPYDNNTAVENRKTQYTLRQTFELQSSEIDKVTQVAKNTDSLIAKGVILSTTSLDYYYSKLPELRVELLGEAMKDARVRAAKIAESDGQVVGSLKSASVGVVQVLAPNSTDVSDYGAYDTSKVEKEVMVTVKAAFALK